MKSMRRKKARPRRSFTPEFKPRSRSCASADHIDTQDHGALTHRPAPWPELTRKRSDPGWPLNCDVLPLNIKGASRFLRKWPSVTLDIEPPEALWPETEGQAASLARVRGHHLHGAGGHGANSRGSWDVSEAGHEDPIPYDPEHARNNILRTEHESSARRDQLPKLA